MFDYHHWLNRTARESYEDYVHSKCNYYAKNELDAYINQLLEFSFGKIFSAESVLYNLNDKGREMVRKDLTNFIVSELIHAFEKKNINLCVVYREYEKERKYHNIHQDYFDKKLNELFLNGLIEEQIEEMDPDLKKGLSKAEYRDWMDSNHLAYLATWMENWALEWRNRHFTIENLNTIIDHVYEIPILNRSVDFIFQGFHDNSPNSNHKLADRIYEYLNRQGLKSDSSFVFLNERVFPQNFTHPLTDGQLHAHLEPYTSLYLQTRMIFGVFGKKYPESVQTYLTEFFKRQYFFHHIHRKNPYYLLRFQPIGDDHPYLEIVVVDSNTLRHDAEQRRWLSDVLKLSRADYKVLVSQESLIKDHHRVSNPAFNDLKLDFSQWDVLISCNDHFHKHLEFPYIPPQGLEDTKNHEVVKTFPAQVFLSPNSLTSQSQCTAAHIQFSEDNHNVVLFDDTSHKLYSSKENPIACVSVNEAKKHLLSLLADYGKHKFQFFKWGPQHKKRLHSLMQAIETAKSPHELGFLIQQQYLFFNYAYSPDLLSQLPKKMQPSQDPKAQKHETRLINRTRGDFFRRISRAYQYLCRTHMEHHSIDNQELIRDHSESKPELSF